MIARLHNTSRPIFRSKEPLKVGFWSDDETDRLADMIAEGWTFSGAARALNRSRNSCIGRFHRHIARNLGEQGE